METFAWNRDNTDGLSAVIVLQCRSDCVNGLMKNSDHNKKKTRTHTVNTNTFISGKKPIYNWYIH